MQKLHWKVSEDLGKRTGQTAGEIWSRNLKEIQKLLFLTKKEQQDLEEFGQLLGRMDMPMQLSAIQFYQEKIMLSLAEAKAAADSRQKLYRYLGALGGAALVLVIILNKVDIGMNEALLFKIAAVGILVSVLSQVLKHSGREEQAFLTSLAGLLLVLFWIIPYVYELFQIMQKLFTL